MNVSMFDAYVARLQSHDWYYDYSDDGAVWRRGDKERRELRKDAEYMGEYKAAFNAYIFWLQTRGENPNAVRDRNQAIADIREAIQSKEKAIS